jgi:hypothetical protein
VSTVAIYYMKAQIIGRSAGRSATGAAAYRAGEHIHDERTGVTYDYTRRRGDIETEILAPAGVSEWATDRSQLWNAVEKAERRGDAQLCREIVVALPVELDREQQRELVRAYVQDQFVSRGMVADVALHRNPGNPHAHIMLTMREMGTEGLSAKKNRDWNRPELLEQWRERWAFESNLALERAGRDKRIDHRSLAEQGSERLPQVHLGPRAHALEQRGVTTEKGDHNRLVVEHNAAVIGLEKARAERRALEIEKTVSARTEKRLQSGWIVPHAQALAALEREAGGQPLTAESLREKSAVLDRQVEQAQSELRYLEREGQRLTRAAQGLKDLAKSQSHLHRHQGPMAALRRLFSPLARANYEWALDQVGANAAYVQCQGVTSEADLQRQLTVLDKERAAIPDLQRTVADLASKRSNVVRALEGLHEEAQRVLHEKARTREVSRGPEWPEDRLRGRQKAREIDRGR